MIYVLSNKNCAETSDDVKLIEDPSLVFETLADDTYLGFDSETQGRNPYTDKMFTIQIGNEKDQFVIDVRLWDIRLFKELLESKILVGVNLKFDLRFLYHNGIRPNKVIDLMLNEINLTNGMYDISETKGKFSFKGLSEQYLGDTDIDKRIGRSFTVKPYDEPLLIEEIRYAAKDVVNPLLIRPLQKEKIDLREVNSVCNLENNFVLALADMEYNGIALDTEKWEGIRILVDERLKESEKELNNIVLGTEGLLGKKIRFGKKTQPLIYEYTNQSDTLIRACGVSWSSPVQVKEAFNAMGISCDSVDKTKLVLIKDQHEIIEKYLDRSKYSALKTKFTDILPTFIDPVSHHIHTDFWQIVSTGRGSSARPNLQQIPSKGSEAKEMRMCFIPDEGEIMVTSDISGAELRLLAEASQDPLWLKTFREGGDLHGVIAAELFGLFPGEVRNPFPLKPDMTYRDVTKIISFGLCYGMTEFKLSNTIKISLPEAKEIINDYFRAVPNVKRYLDNAGRQGRTKGVSYTFGPIHRPRYYNLKKAYAAGPDKNKIFGEYERASKNHGIQGGNADWIKIAIYLIYKYIQENKYPAKLRLQVHDEIVTSVRQDLGQEWAKIQEDLMIKAGSYFIKSIPITVETKVDAYWSK